MLGAMGHTLLSLAPWLLLGTLVAGLLHGLLPQDFLRRHLRGKGGVMKAVFLGVPLPLCSCGVIPAGLGLQKDGASKGAAVGFLISTPQTGIDSILVSTSFLGLPFALFKVFSAAVTGLVGGWMTDTLDRTPSVPRAQDASGHEAPARHTLKSMLSHASDIIGSIWRWVVIGIIVSAAIEVYLPSAWMNNLAAQGRLIPVLFAIVVSLPMYVCATASVPIAASFVEAGLPPSAALVFLIAGPASNLATMGAVYRGLGRRALGVYLLTIVMGSVGFGLLFDSVLPGTGRGSAIHHENVSWWAVSCSVVLTLILFGYALRDLNRWLKSRSRPRHAKATPPPAKPACCKSQPAASHTQAP